MKVTIITATFNSEAKLQCSIDSVASQDYKNIEHIIVDGGSTDGTLEIIARNKEKIAHFISEKDNGIYDALNKGIKCCSGDIIGFLNSDDVYDNTHVVSLIVENFIEKHADVIYGNLIYLTKGRDKQKPFRHWESNDFSPNSLKYGWMPPHPTMYCTKEVYEICGLYNDSFRISADYDYILRVFGRPEFRKHHIPEVLVNMDIGGISNKSLKNIIRKSKEDYQAIKQNKIGGFQTVLFKNLRKLKQFTRVVAKSRNND